ncbi:MAG: tetratricopeptide repeat protein, partial [bacterium]|nr:tetratricopeptide repeat protein [bacterium]
GNPKIHNNLGNVAFFRKDFLTAVRYWQESKDSDPANTSVLFNLGLGYEKLGETEKALSYYRLFSQKAPPKLEKMRQTAVRKLKALESRL